MQGPRDKEEPFDRPTEEKLGLVPPSRRPPTAVGAETPPPSRPDPVRLTQRRPRDVQPGRIFLAVLTVVAVVLLSGAVGNLVSDATSENVGKPASLAALVVLGVVAVVVWWRVERKGKALK